MIPSTWFLGFYTIFSLLFSSIAAAQVHPIYWNSSNEMFIGDKDRMLTVKLMDTVDIHCPFYKDTVTRDEAEFSYIYSVSKEGYENCILDNSHAVGQCMSPHSGESIRLVIRDFSPTPNALEYLPGQTYYFISTSDGTEPGVKNKEGGLCRERHMRMMLNVEKEAEAVTLDAKSASSMDRHKISSQDDLDRRPTISKNSANALYATGRASSAIRRQYTTGQLSSDAAAISDRDENESKDDSPVGVNFIADANKLIQSTPSADGGPADVDGQTQADGRTNSLTYDPYGQGLGSNSVKRDHSSETRPSDNDGRSQSANGERIVLFEIHEMEPQRINRYNSNSATSSRSSRWSIVVLIVSLAVLRRWLSL